MDKILISDLEAQCHVGVSEAERSRPQRLAVTVEMDFDLSRAASSDNLDDTIDYFAVAQSILALAQSRPWNLIESLAGAIAQSVLDQYKPIQVAVEVKKFVIPQARFVSVRMVRGR